MVKTAVLMATYNGSQFIEKQLDSIRKQTLAPDYVLMRDDCSTDDTVEVVKNYIQRYNLSGWSIQKNNFNLGWRRNFRQLMLDIVVYDVDYVFFSDQDDIWYLDKNERQVTVMEERADIDLLSSDIDIEITGQEATVPKNFEFVDRENKLSQYPKDFSYHNYRQGWTFCLRKTFLDIVVKYYTEELITSHDNLMAGISGILETGYNLNQPVGLHIRHGGNASGNILGLHSNYDRHIAELHIVKSYYQVLVSVLKEKKSLALSRAQAYLDFNRRRLTNAKQKKFFATLTQMVTDGNYYDSLTNRLRDAIFLFKK
ncbi:TPA: glycosyltransferase [Streptococcus suis]|uniref:Glycosyltransferase n=2 Tax=Streptococcus TaxID=1301 RepID=A0A4T2GRE5_STRSU|nr:glycosyltransferase [Streptococcus sp. 29896]MBL6538323.1 glycosyltransferase [Streptococcus suis]MBM7269241.1 glycosyltransferase [Streptococcus suis]MBM7315357.1 glycosyltransferase [Streptococcus suis]MCK4028061.1 glycosyltransferase [Streptococcus suis]TII01270.1 glycosyltransferase [Streptococcus suis]